MPGESLNTVDYLAGALAYTVVMRIFSQQYSKFRRQRLSCLVILLCSVWDVGGYVLAAQDADSGTRELAEEGQPLVSDDNADTPDAAASSDNPASSDSSENSENSDKDSPADDSVAAAERAQLLNSAAALEQRLAILNQTAGPYDPARLEVQQDLARLQQQLNNHETAEQLLSDSLQLARLNFGLYDESQVSILQALAQARQSLRDWEGADAAAHLLFQIQRRLHDPDSAEYAQALLDYSQWQISASRQNLLLRPGSTQAIMAIRALSEEQRRALDEARQRQDARQQWDLLNAIAASEIEMARQYDYQRLDDLLLNEPRFVTETVCRLVSDGAGGTQRVCYQQQVNNPDYYRSARRERVNQLERARYALMQTAQEMENFSKENPAFTAENQQEVTARLQEMAEMNNEMGRLVRRARLRSW